MTERLEAPSSITMTSAGAFAADLRHVVMTNDAIGLALSDVVEADLSFVQIVQSARILANAHGKSFALDGAPSPAVMALLDRAGLGADANADDRVFWHGEGVAQ